MALWGGSQCPSLALSEQRAVSTITTADQYSSNPMTKLLQQYIAETRLTFTSKRMLFNHRGEAGVQGIDDVAAIWPRQDVTSSDGTEQVQSSSKFRR